MKYVEFFGDESASVTLDNEKSLVEVFCHICDYSKGDKVRTESNVLRTK